MTSQLSGYLKDNPEYLESKVRDPSGPAFPLPWRNIRASTPETKRIMTARPAASHSGLRRRLLTFDL